MKPGITTAAAFSLSFVISGTSCQTPGMDRRQERREDRRDDRQERREERREQRRERWNQEDDR